MRHNGKKLSKENRIGLFQGIKRHSPPADAKAARVELLRELYANGNGSENSAEWDELGENAFSPFDAMPKLNEPMPESVKKGLTMFERAELALIECFGAIPQFAAKMDKGNRKKLGAIINKQIKGAAVSPQEYADINYCR